MGRKAPKSGKKRKRDFQMLYLCTCKSETGTALRATRPIYFVRVFDKFAIVNRDEMSVEKKQGKNKQSIFICFYLLMFYFSKTN